jgi:hypothetical protein
MAIHWTRQMILRESAQLTPVEAESNSQQNNLCQHAHLYVYKLLMTFCRFPG